MKLNGIEEANIKVERGRKSKPEISFAVYDTNVILEVNEFSMNKLTTEVEHYHYIHGRGWTGRAAIAGRNPSHRLKRLKLQLSHTHDTSRLHSTFITQNHFLNHNSVNFYYITFMAFSILFSVGNSHSLLLTFMTFRASFYFLRCWVAHFLWWDICAIYIVHNINDEKINSFPSRRTHIHFTWNEFFFLLLGCCFLGFLFIHSHSHSRFRWMRNLIFNFTMHMCHIWLSISQQRRRSSGHTKHTLWIQRRQHETHFVSPSALRFSLCNLHRKTSIYYTIFVCVVRGRRKLLVFEFKLHCICSRLRE